MIFFYIRNFIFNFNFIIIYFILSFYNINIIFSYNLIN